jgi:hypothetical protein
MDGWRQACIKTGGGLVDGWVGGHSGVRAYSGRACGHQAGRLSARRCQRSEHQGGREERALPVRPRGRRLRACHQAVRKRRDGEPHLVRVRSRVGVSFGVKVGVRAVVSITSEAKAALGTVTDPTPTMSNTELVAPPARSRALNRGGLLAHGGAAQSAAAAHVPSWQRSLADPSSAAAHPRTQSAPAA